LFVPIKILSIAVLELLWIPVRKFAAGCEVEGFSKQI
jgi:hypothetical protein